MRAALRESDDPVLVALAARTRGEQLRIFRQLKLRERRELGERWALFAHRGQLAPRGRWRVWLIRAGRGFGKTRAGAEWVWNIARTVPRAQIALVGGSVQDVTKVMIRGHAGLINTARAGEHVDFKADNALIELGDHGAVAHIYSAMAPETLRGPQHHAAWCDELAKWRSGPKDAGTAAWDNLMLGLRSGADARCVVTTTPRPNALMQRVMARDDAVEILPLADEILASLSQGLQGWFPGLRLAIDLNRVPALAEDRALLWDSVTKADFLSDTEKRVMLGIAEPEQQP